MATIGPNKTNKRLAIYVATLFVGGAERVAVNLAAGLSALGYNVDLVVCDATGPMRQSVEHSVRVVDLACGNVKKGIIPFRSYILGEMPFAIIAIQTDCNIAALLARIFSWVYVPIIITEHSVLKQPGMAYSTGVLLRRILQFFLYRKADQLVVVSEGVLEDYRKYLRSWCPPASVVYNPVFSETKLESSVCERLNSTDARYNKPFVLGVGRLTRAKGFDLLIDAFSKLANHIDHNLLILGEGEEREALELKIQNYGLTKRVCLKGFVANPYPYFQDTAVFVLSSYWEGFGVVLVEALACGTPVISTDCHSGPREVLAGGEFGRLVPVNDADALAEAIKDQLSLDRPLEDRVRRKARARIFSIDAAAKQYHNILSDLR